MVTPPPAATTMVMTSTTDQAFDFPGPYLFPEYDQPEHWTLKSYKAQPGITSRTADAFHVLHTGKCQLEANLVRYRNAAQRTKTRCDNMVLETESPRHSRESWNMTVVSGNPRKIWGIELQLGNYDPLTILMWSVYPPADAVLLGMQLWLSGIIISAWRWLVGSIWFIWNTRHISL